jgi:hypothetical protein
MEKNKKGSDYIKFLDVKGEKRLSEMWNVQTCFLNTVPYISKGRWGE